MKVRLTGRAGRLAVTVAGLLAGSAWIVSGGLAAGSGLASTGGAGAAPLAKPTPPPVGGLRPGTTFTPLTASVISRPQPVKGTDGRYHLAYELLLTNVAGRPVHVGGIEVIAARTRKVLLRLAGPALAADMNPVGSRRGCRPAPRWEPPRSGWPALTLPCPPPRTRRASWTSASPGQS